MPETKFLLMPLEARTRMLLVESELNRVQLLSELRGFQYALAPLKQHVRAVRSLVSSIAGMAAAFAAIRDALTHREKDGEAKRSLIFTLLSGLRGAWQSHPQ
jgi:hypothetical protein